MPACSSETLPDSLISHIHGDRPTVIPGKIRQIEAWLIAPVPVLLIVHYDHVYIRKVRPLILTRAEGAVNFALFLIPVEDLVIAVKPEPVIHGSVPLQVGVETGQHFLVRPRYQVKGTLHHRPYALSPVSKVPGLPQSDPAVSRQHQEQAKHIGNPPLTAQRPEITAHNHKEKRVSQHTGQNIPLLQGRLAVGDALGHNDRRRKKDLPAQLFCLFPVGQKDQPHQDAGPHIPFQVPMCRIAPYLYILLHGYAFIKPHVRVIVRAHHENNDKHFHHKENADRKKIGEPPSDRSAKTGDRRLLPLHPRIQHIESHKGQKQNKGLLVDRHENQCAKACESIPSPPGGEPLQQEEEPDRKHHDIVGFLRPQLPPDRRLVAHHHRHGKEGGIDHIALHLSRAVIERRKRHNDFRRLHN